MVYIMFFCNVVKFLSKIFDKSTLKDVDCENSCEIYNLLLLEIKKIEKENSYNVPLLRFFTIILNYFKKKNNCRNLLNVIKCKEGQQRKCDPADYEQRDCTCINVN